MVYVGTLAGNLVAMGTKLYLNEEGRVVYVGTLAGKLVAVGTVSCI